MRIPYKRLLVAINICAVVFITGCVDTDVNPLPPSIDYQSQMKVVNLVQGAGTATLTLNGQSLGTVDFGSETPGSSAAFLTVPSGSKSVDASFTTAANQNYRFAATTEYKMRVFLVGTSAASNAFVQFQRYIWQTKDSQNGAALFPADTGWVAFFNGSPDATISTVEVNGEDIHLNSIVTGSGSSYVKLPAGTHTFDVYYNDDADHITFDIDVASKGRYTATIYDVAASIKNAVFVDD
ncbi:MAG TPA: DUF4397 domain-containing protein [Ignavibacteriaceae bacterium]